MIYYDYTIEEGVDKDNTPCWFVIKDADFITFFYSLAEAKYFAKHESQIH